MKEIEFIVLKQASKNNLLTNKIIQKQRINLEGSYHLVLRLTINHSNQHSMGLAKGFKCIDQGQE